MPGPISPPHAAGQGGPLGHSVASVFHGLHNGAMAPRQGHALRPSPMHGPVTSGAPMALMTSGRPTAAFGHAPAFGGMAASAAPRPVIGSQLPTG